MREPTGTIRPRRAWVAMALTFGATGLGQVYCGRLAKGLLLFFLSFAFVPAMGFAARFAPGTAVLLAAAFFVLLIFAVFFYALIDAALLARRLRGGYALKDYNRWYVYALFVVFSVAYPTTYADIIRTHVFQPFKIPSASMAPTILPGDFVLLNKFVYDQGPPRRGDIVVFVHPNDRSRFYIKRIAAMPGDTVSVENGLATVNGRLLAQGPGERKAMPGVGPGDDYLVAEEKNGRASYPVIAEAGGGRSVDMAETRVPNGQCFVLGDFRSKSEDSREFGFVPLADVLGRAEYIYLPALSWRRFGAIGLDADHKAVSGKD